MPSTSGTRRTTPPGEVPFETPEEEVPHPPAGIVWNAWEHMPGQEASWTCAACAQAWVLRATGVRPDAGEWDMVAEIGYPDHINGTYGLMDGSGAQVARVYDENYGIPTAQAWLSFDEVYELAKHTTGQMSGGAWYHWVALRGTQGANLWIANSAPGYKGVWDTLTRADFNRLGPFSVVWLVE